MAQAHTLTVQYLPQAGISFKRSELAPLLRIVLKGLSIYLFRIRSINMQLNIGLSSKIFIFFA